MCVEVCIAVCVAMCVEMCVAVCVTVCDAVYIAMCVVVSCSELQCVAVRGVYVAGGLVDVAGRRRRKFVDDQIAR